MKHSLVVVACAAVLTGAQCGALVEVEAAQKAAPARLAFALPRLRTRTVLAARVDLALVAVVALPAVVTSATEQIRLVSFCKHSIGNKFGMNQWY